MTQSISLKITPQKPISLSIARSVSVFTQDERVEELTRRVNALENIVSSDAAKTTYLALAAIHTASEISVGEYDPDLPSMIWDGELQFSNPRYGFSTTIAPAPNGARSSAGTTEYTEYFVLEVPRSLAGQRGKLSLFFGAFAEFEPDSRPEVNDVNRLHQWFLYRLQTHNRGTTQWEVLPSVGQDSFSYRIVHNYSFLGGELITLATETLLGTQQVPGRRTALEVHVYETGIAL